MLARGPAADTIFALASGVGRSAVAVIRISGDQASRVLGSLCDTLPPPRRAHLRRLRDMHGHQLDQAIVLWLPGPGSYTGEDSAELHVHGGPAVLHSVSAALVAAGGRPADPGEFTRRAFASGKMDLLRAEAVADLVEAETPAQQKQALAGLSGGNGGVLADWAERLVRALAWQEALIDFSDEQLPEDVEREMLADVARLRTEVLGHAQAADQAARLRRGLVFAIVGAPNVGKSSILNRLAGRDVAIVSDEPGTTRDVLSAEVVLTGIPVTLIDTAGVRKALSEVEKEGVRRALHHAREADLVIQVFAQDQAVVPAAGDAIQVFNKVDLSPGPAGVLGVSAKTGAGFDLLRQHLADKARHMARPEGTPAFTRARHAAALRDAAASLASCLRHSQPELRAEDLRSARQAVGRITGEMETEAVLDTIFGAFCVGK